MFLEYKKYHIYGFWSCLVKTGPSINDVHFFTLLEPNLSYSFPYIIFQSHQLVANFGKNNFKNLTSFMDVPQMALSMCMVERPLFLLVYPYNNKLSFALYFFKFVTKNLRYLVMEGLILFSNDIIRIFQKDFI